MYVGIEIEPNRTMVNPERIREIVSPILMREARELYGKDIELTMDLEEPGNLGQYGKIKIGFDAPGNGYSTAALISRLDRVYTPLIERGFDGEYTFDVHGQKFEGLTGLLHMIKVNALRKGADGKFYDKFSKDEKGNPLELTGEKLEIRRNFIKTLGAKVNDVLANTPEVQNA